MLVENVERREKYEEIILLRECILKIDDEINEMIEKEKVETKKKIEHKSMMSTVQIDLLMASLFGNGIVIWKSM